MRGLLNDGLFTSNTDEWCTPPGLFSALDAEFGFTLDVAASDENHLLPRYFTKADDGIAKDWTGERVFCNPPYSDCKAWAWKCHKGGADLAVLLVPSRTDTAWFHQHVWNKAEIRFIRGRLRFSGAKWNAPFPSLLAIYRGAA